MLRISRVLVFAGVALTLSVPAFAQSPQGPGVRPGPPGGFGGPGGPGPLAGVNLSEAQRDQIRDLREHNRASMREQMQQLRDAQKALHQEIFAEAPNQSKIDGLQQQVLALRQQSEARRLELQQRIAQVLTPEQRKFVRERGPEMRAFQAGRMMERRRMLQQRRPRGEF